MRGHLETPLRRVGENMGKFKEAIEKVEVNPQTYQLITIYHFSLAVFLSFYNFVNCCLPVFIFHNPKRFITFSFSYLLYMSASPLKFESVCVNDIVHFNAEQRYNALHLDDS